MTQLIVATIENTVSMWYIMWKQTEQHTNLTARICYHIEIKKEVANCLHREYVAVFENEID